ncbi:hypothetical protein GCM10028796_17480 [Ramlibacter monticola]|uniref:Uncharacterized protein n=1 Tax=Ramlibacter monticola TaxID=1926872 RepID=A0A937CSJ3_9BURK|nr:hypothetical protein [Ramlibacter monticola]MBL0390573.1 hypothetical protein [Ramlibacter monticola]
MTARLQAFTVNIGRRGSPRLSFSCMAPDACSAQMQHLDLAEVGERVEVVPALAQKPEEIDLDEIRKAGL